MDEPISRQLRHYRKLRAAGLCPCGDEVETPYKTCADCRAKKAIISRRRAGNVSDAPIRSWKPLGPGETYKQRAKAKYQANK